MTLTENALMADITALDTQKDDRGAWLKNAAGYTVVVSPQNETALWKILNTEEQVDSANNTKNRVYALRNKIKPVTWKELGASYTGWFVFARGRDAEGMPKGAGGLMAQWRQRPEFEKESDLKTHSVSYGVTMSFRAWHETWRGSVGHLSA